MSALEAPLAEGRAAADRFLATAQGWAGAKWGAPHAPGKWSPAEILDHLRQSYDVSLRLLRGEPVIRRAPWIVRAVLGRVFFPRIVRTGRFPKSRTLKPFQPTAPAPDLPAGAARLREAIAAFEAEAERAAAAGDGTFEHPGFGRVAIADYARFAALHTEHHRRQLAAPH